MGALRFFLPFAALLLGMPLTQAAEIAGSVINAETGQSMARVNVYLSGTGHRTETGEDGRFLFRGVEPGEYLLIASSVGFGLVKKPLSLADGGDIELQILLNPGTLLTEHLTVSADILSPRAELRGAEVQKLKSVFLDDPVRALQQLPGIVASDDFNSGFAMRGSGFDRVGVLFDGIPVYAFLHTMEGAKDTGSTSVLSAELIEDMDLVRGGSSAEWGGNSGGFLKLRSRSGNSSHWRNFLSVSGSAVLGVSEGPLGNGSWIASARKSYVDWIVRRIDERAELNFGFHDFFAKVNQNRGRKDLFSFRFFHGNTGLTDVRENIGQNTIDKGRFVSSLGHFSWTHLFNERLTAESHLYLQQADSLNRNRNGIPIWKNDQTVGGLRSVWDYQVMGNWAISGGITAERWNNGHRQDAYDYGRREWFVVTDFEAETSRQEVFAQSRLPLHRKAVFSAGLAWGRLAATPHRSVSPFAALEVMPTDRQLVTVSWGESHQFPFLMQLFGEYGSRSLLPERARMVDAGWAYRLPTGMEMRLFGYHRRRFDVPWRKEGLWRLVNGQIAYPSTNPFSNALSDRSLGLEAMLGRRAENGLSGWLGYAWGQSRWSEGEEIWFPGNYDQRHSANLFAHYRWSSRLDLSLKWKFASGLPIPAYARKQGKDYFVCAHRNMERLPNYSRIDARVAKGFDKDRYRITLFVEAVNLLNRDNHRFSGIGLDHINLSTGQLYHLVQPQFPLLPTAGMIVEF
jgi:hypothetical protein